MHRENSLHTENEKFLKQFCDRGSKVFSMLKTGQSLGHLGTSGGAEHTLVPGTGLHFLLSQAGKWGGRHWPGCGGGVGGREPGETNSRQVVAGEASTNLGDTDRHTQGNHEDREHENRLDLVEPGSQSMHRGFQSRVLQLRRSGKPGGGAGIGHR